MSVINIDFTPDSNCLECVEGYTGLLKAVSTLVIVKHDRINYGVFGTLPDGSEGQLLSITIEDGGNVVLHPYVDIEVKR